MEIRNISFKNLFIILFAPFMFAAKPLSLLILGSREIPFVYLNAFVFAGLSFLIVVYTVLVSRSISELFIQKSKIFKSLAVVVFSLGFVIAVSGFVHKIVEGLLFFHLLILALGINIILTLIISSILKKLIKQ